MITTIRCTARSFHLDFVARRSHLLDFGKLPSVDRVDFTLPDDPTETRESLRRAPPRSGAPIVRLGTPRWNDRTFIGVLYPKSLPATRFLDHYAREFDAIELNTTFYAIRPELLRRWADRTPARFRFCPKLPRIVSHVLQLQHADTITAEFVDAVAALGDRLGPSWLLLPPSFGPDLAPRLDAFLARWAPELSIAVEARHRDWFRPGHRERFFEILARHGADTVITDVAGRRDVVHMTLTSPRAFIRFVGNRHHPSDFTRVEAWSDRLAGWFDAGLREANVFLHQPDEGLNVAIARRVAELLRQRGVDVRSPEVQPEQTALF